MILKLAGKQPSVVVRPPSQRRRDCHVLLNLPDPRAGSPFFYLTARGGSRLTLGRFGVGPDPLDILAAGDDSPDPDLLEHSEQIVAELLLDDFAILPVTCTFFRILSFLSAMQFRGQAGGGRVSLVRKGPGG